MSVLNSARRRCRATLVLLAAVTSTCLLGTAALVGLPGAANAAVMRTALTSETSASPLASYPDCGTISLTSVTWSNNKFEFKIVATDLSPWLGKALGSMFWYMDAPDAETETGDVNASPTAGARTGVLSISPVHSNQTLTVEVGIFIGSNAQCYSYFYLPAADY
jgi:hypothetical protein